MIQTIVHEKKMSAVVVLHDLNLALRFADRYLMLKDGEVFADGGKEVITKGNISQVYDVEVDIEWIQEKPVVIPV